MRRHLEWLRGAFRPGMTQRWSRWVGRNWARMSYGRHVEPAWLEITQHPIAIADLPAPYEGFRVVHLSDLHGGKSVPLAFLREAVELANHQHPDLVAITGDFIHKGYRYIDRVAEVVSKLSARHGVFAVLGNHDFSVRNALGFRRYRQLHQAMADALEKHGVHVLRNRSHRLVVAGAPLHLVGVDDLWSGSCDLDAAFAGVPPHGPRLLLAHNPRTVERLRNHRCDVILSGHTHGGQVNWPGLGPVFVPLSRGGRRFVSGLYRHSSSHVFVNRGIGHGIRFRFGVRPEVAVLQLLRAAPG